MVKNLRQRAEIAEAQLAFQGHSQTAGEPKSIKAGYPGESHTLDGIWIAAENIWVGFRTLDNRYWNAFGIGLEASNSIRCEINFPIEGRNDQISGVLAKDEAGVVWILHRGRLRGVTRAQFERQYRGKWKNAEGDPYAVVAALGEPDFVKHVADFVRVAAAMKIAAK
jgi:hypothetical protein